MASSSSLTNCLWELFQWLRRQGFVIGTEDYDALRQALQAGFGWTSRDEFRDVCQSLWATSRQEQEIFIAMFERLMPSAEAWEEEYALPKSTPRTAQVIKPLPPANDGEEVPEASLPTPRPTSQSDLKTEAQGQLPSLSLVEELGRDKLEAGRPFVFMPQYPLRYRDVAQTWRRLRRSLRTGPATELDIEGTIARRCQVGVATRMVLRPRRRNTMRLLLLVDRQGSMDPFHPFLDEVCTAIQQSGRLDETSLYYFHNVPAEGADEEVLEQLTGQLFPALDPILDQIEPLTEGLLYSDPALLEPELLTDVLQGHDPGIPVAIISDAGAARRRYRISRLLDTIAFMKGLRSYTSRYVWLNPLPKGYWRNSTAAQIARHIPMFSLEKETMQQAVNILRGQHHIIEQSL